MSFSSDDLCDRLAAVPPDGAAGLLVELAVAGCGADTGFAAGVLRRRSCRTSALPGHVVAVYVTRASLTDVAVRAGVTDPLWIAGLELHPDAVVDGRWWVGPLADADLRRLDEVLPSQRVLVAPWDPSDPPGYVALAWDLHRRSVTDVRSVALAVLTDRPGT